MRALQKTVVKKIAATMAAKKPAWSIGKLSVEADIDKSFLAKLLRNERRMNLEHLGLIAKALKVEPSALLGK